MEGVEPNREEKKRESWRWKGRRLTKKRRREREERGRWKGWKLTE